MGYFLRCFGGYKDGDTCKNKRNYIYTFPKCQGHGRQNAAEWTTRIDYGTPKRATEPVNVFPQQPVSEEQFSASPTRKKVAFDSREEFEKNVFKLIDVDPLSENDYEGSGVKPDYARDRSMYVHPVLNPVENLFQWKAVKSEGTPLRVKPQKENSTTNFEAPRISVSSELSLKHLASSKPKPNQLKTTNQGVTVDASHWNWLVTPETITLERSGSQCSNSVISFEDKPISGVLTVDELRYMSATNSPRKTPTHSPDDRPIIGPVGTYWNDTSSTNDYARSSSFKGIPNATSKYSEDKKVKWNATPFEIRLERALNGGGSSELD